MNIYVTSTPLPIKATLGKRTDSESLYILYIAVLLQQASSK